MKLHNGINSDLGWASLKINDKDNILTDSTNSIRDSKIERQWDIQIYLGKSQPLLQRWFYGKIIEVITIRPRTNQQEVVLSCVGWAATLRDRLTNIKRFQGKAADGITVDSTCTSTKVSELVKNIIEDTDHQADHGLDNSDLGITTNNIQDIDVKLPDFQRSFTPYSQAISELASSGNVMWGIDADRDLFFRDPGSIDSGFLFTNDLAGDTAQNWDSSRIGYLINASQSWRDSSYEGAYSVLHALGSNTVKIDQQNSGSENAVRTSNTSYIGIPFTPQQDNIGKIALRLGKTGTPTSPVTITIANVNTSDSNSPKLSSFKKSITLDSAKVQSLSTSGDWTELGIQEKIDVEVGTPLMIVIHKYGDGSNNLTMDYKTGSGTFWTSADGVDGNWSSATGLFSMRDYSQKALQIILENTRARQKYGTREMKLQFNAGQEEGSAREALISAGEVLGLERRYYAQVTVSPPTLRIPLGQYCRIYDAKTGLSVKANITSTQIEMTSRAGETSIGANKVILGLEEVHY